MSVFGTPGVDAVVAHLVADAVRRPAERELGEVARAEHDPAALVGDPEQVVRAQAGLDVLERDVVDLLAARERVAELARASAVAVGRMSSSCAVIPSARISAWALAFVPAEVAKPGSVKPRMSLRGRPARSIALAATISAWVESRPPETPMTTFGAPIASSRCCSPATWML